MRKPRKGDLVTGKDYHWKEVVVRVTKDSVDFGWTNSPYEADNISTGEHYSACSGGRITTLACI